MQSGKPQPPKVALLVDTSTGWGRRLVRGVGNYALQHGPWHLWVVPRGRGEPMKLPSDWGGDGVIARLTNAKMATDILSKNCRLVNVSSIKIPEIKVPSVRTSYEESAKIAMEHLAARGLKNFAYIGPTKNPYVAEHADEFRQQIPSSSRLVSVFDCGTESMVTNWSKRRTAMIQWISELEKPVGVFSWGTTPAMQLLDACREANVNVPDDVSVLAGDDDELMCNTTSPTLSGLLVASEQIGYRAAELLNQLMQGEDQTVADIKIDPIQVNMRQSTDALAIDDYELLVAVKYIRENACKSITVQNVADDLAISRRSLERKFKESFNRTPLEEIQRIRLVRVRELLLKTDLNMPKIAAQSGFGTPEYMATAFKAKFGITPLKYRSQVRAR